MFWIFIRPCAGLEKVIKINFSFRVAKRLRRDFVTVNLNRNRRYRALLCRPCGKAPRPT